MIGRLAAAAAAGAAGCVAYGVAVEAHDFQVRRLDVPVLPPGAGPVRLLHLSDLHLLPRQTRKRDFVRGLNGLEPDLVVGTGDTISSRDAVGPLVASLGPLLERPGAFVFGSNDFASPSLGNPLKYLWRTTAKHEASDQDLPTDTLRAALGAGGWVCLDNARAELEVRGVRFSLRGTGDAHEKRDDYAAVAGAADPAAVNVGVTHAPYLRVLDAMTDDGVQLILAGHTHGGQVRVPGYGALTSNCDLPPAFAQGLFEYSSGDHTAWVHVSAGLGQSPYAPFRFACPPEVTLLRLVARPAM